VRALLSAALRSPELDWRHQPLENLDLGHNRRLRRNGHNWAEAECDLELGTLGDLVEDNEQYVVTAEVFAAFE
jgi:hypothetical protein